MRVRLNIAGNIKFLQLKADDGDADAQAHIESASPTQSGAFLFDAYLVLSNGRADHAPILTSEITAYANFVGITSSIQKLRLMRAVYALDRVYRESRRGGT